MTAVPGHPAPDDDHDEDQGDGDEDLGPGPDANGAGGVRHGGTVPPGAAGERLDKVLAAQVPDLSRSRVRALLEHGHVRLDGRTIADASQRVKPGQAFDIFVPEAEPATPEAQDIPLSVVHEDEDVLVIDKPAGLVVHPAAGNPDNTLVNALLAHCGASLSGIGGVRRPGIVHRLDKDTSGLMVVAKNDRAHHALTAQFADRSLSRTYHALVWGVPSPKEGTVDAPIGRCPADRKKMAVVAGPAGKRAVTRYRVLRAWGRAAALVECVLETGRTHQIRVHMAHLGHPVVGDPLYGRGRPARPRGANAAALPEAARARMLAFPRQALHAVGLAFVHPSGGEAVRFSVDLAPDIRELIDGLERS